MATYSELYDLRSNDLLRKKVTVAVVIAARDKLALPTPTTAQARWARQTLASPGDVAVHMLDVLLAGNKDAPTSAILAADDATIQSAVNAVVDGFIAGGE